MSPLVPGRNARFEVGGVDISEHVTGFEMRMETEAFDASPSFQERVSSGSRTYSIELTAPISDALQAIIRRLEEALPQARMYYDEVPVPIVRPEWQEAVEANQRLAGVAPHRPVDHEFEQDPAEQATLCVECGMWPEHHNHSGGYGAFGCICQECVTDAEFLP